MPGVFFVKASDPGQDITNVKKLKQMLLIWSNKISLCCEISTKFLLSHFLCVWDRSVSATLLTYIFFLRKYIGVGKTCLCNTKTSCKSQYKCSGHRGAICFLPGLPCICQHHLWLPSQKAKSHILTF